MSTSTFSIVRAAHCSVVAVAWMKTIRAPKTSGTSYENKKDLSADKKKQSSDAALVLRRSDKKGRTWETPARAELPIAGLRLPAVRIGSSRLCKARCQPTTSPMLSCPGTRGFLLVQIRSLLHMSTQNHRDRSPQHDLKCCSHSPCLTSTTWEGYLGSFQIWRSFNFLSDILEVLHSKAQLFVVYFSPAKSTPKITTSIWSMECHSDDVKEVKETFCSTNFHPQNQIAFVDGPNIKLKSPGLFYISRSTILILHPKLY